VLLALLCVCGSNIFFPKAEAANTGLTIQPVKVSHTLTPGEVITGRISLTNAGEDDIIVSVKVEDFIPTAGSNGIQFVGRAPGATTVRDWVTLDTKSEVEFKGNEQKSIQYTITVPKDAEPGGHFGVAFFKAMKKGDEEQLKVGTQVGMLMLVTIPGNHLQKGEIRDFSVPVWQQRPPVVFKINFENTGTVHFEPKGTITIKNIFGKKVGEVPVEGQVVLPTGVKDLVVEWKPDTFVIGPYTAELSLFDGEGNPLASHKTRFYMIPLWYIGGFVLGLIIVFGGLTFIKKRLKFSVSLK
jgi:uncharacterized repeat protein (TIGR01451 family)